MEKKYIGITDEAVNAGVANGSFSEADIRQIRDRSGRFVKHIREQPHSKSLLPASVIQVNHVYLYQADLRPIMQAIANARDVRVADDLSEKYRLVLSKLERFLNHRRILESLNEVAGDAAEIFELRLSPMLDKIDHRDPDVPACTELIGMLRAQVNIEFIYLLSTFWIDRDSVSRDTGLPRRLDTLDSKLRKTLEQMLAYQYDPRNGFMLGNSLYGKYLVQGKDGTSHLKQFLQHDSRFASYDEFMQFILNHYLEYTGDKDHFGNPVGQARFGFNFTVDQTHFNNDKRHSLACQFHRVLCDLRQLRIILDELKEARKIEPDDIEVDPGLDGNDAIRLIAPPQLPAPSSK